MTSYEIFSLSKFIDSSVDLSNYLSDFRCERDRDVRNFLTKSAIVNEKKHLSRTYLIFETGSKDLAAYFTIAISSVNAGGIVCSETMKKKLNINRDEIMQSYLIGQIGRDDRTEKGTGQIALNYAIDLIKEINSKIGCRVVRLDCKDEPSLMDHYKKNGFTYVRSNKENNLNQMIKII